MTELGASNTDPLHPLIARLDRWLRENRPRYHHSLLPGATENELDEFEQTLGFRLPPFFRALYQWRNGGEEFIFEETNGFVGCFQGPYEFMCLTSVQSTWSMLTELLGGGEFDAVNWWHRSWIPFLYFNGNLVCLDLHGVFTGNKGQILQFWAHEEDRQIVAPSLETWLGYFVEDLEAGKYSVNAYEEIEWITGSEIVRPPDHPIRYRAGQPDLAARGPAVSGDLVRVTDGAFAGMEGEILRVDRKSFLPSLEVELTVFRRLVPITVAGGNYEFRLRAAREEKDWLSCTDVRQMLWPFRDLSRRKRLLLACAISRRLWHVVESLHLAAAVEQAEAAANDPAIPDERLQEWAVETTGWQSPEGGITQANLNPLTSFDYIRLKEIVSIALQACPTESGGYAQMVRCIVGNPTRKVVIDRAWVLGNCRAAIQLAEAADASRELPHGTFDHQRMGVLADALEEAGYDNADLLNHCRQPGEHVRGCWVIDRLLGKE